MRSNNLISVGLSWAFFTSVFIYFSKGSVLDTIPDDRNSTDEVQAALDIKEMNDNLTIMAQVAIEADWQYNTNVTSENEVTANEKYLEFSNAFSAYHKEVIEFYEWQNFQDPYLVRQFQRQSSLGTSALNDTSLNELNTIIGKMTATFTNKVCPYDNKECDWEKEGMDIDRLEIEMAENRVYTELTYYWEQWRLVTGKEIVDQYSRYVELENMAASLNGFADAGDMWLQPYSEGTYTTGDFKSDIEEIWQELKDLYQKLHAYVRYKLIQNHYEKYIDEFEPIPANVLGNMWAQSWENIYDYVAPFPEQELLDLTDVLQGKIKNETEMFDIAEDFFTSIDLYNMTEDFQQNTMYVQPTDRTVICHASAWDFLSTESPLTDGKFRIKMCTNKNQEDFIVIHHEMGHIEYQMAYSEVNGTIMPTAFRDGANPGFHEAIGDTIALSVSTPTHLQMIYDYLNNTKDSFERRKKSARDAYEQDINFLMKTALAKVTFIPYAYILDLWRWKVFSGNITSDKYNYEWWKMRLEYQGIAPSVKRHPSEDFDIGCKYHVVTSVPYIRYFVAHILQFQFHERLCNLITTPNEIYNCDIYKEKEAGQHLRDTILIKGASEPWKDILSDFLGIPNSTMTAKAIKNYFSPLLQFLEEEIIYKNIPFGWDGYSVDDFIEENVTIPGTIPIIVGIVLAIMVAIVIIAYIIGVSRQKKKDQIV